jgi:hypothetical protein
VPRAAQALAPRAGQPQGVGSEPYLISTSQDEPVLSPSKEHPRTPGRAIISAVAVTPRRDETSGLVPCIIYRLQAPLAHGRHLTYFLMSIMDCRIISSSTEHASIQYNDRTIVRFGKIKMDR